MASQTRTTSKITRILYLAKGIVEGSLTLGILSLIIFVTLHYARIPVAGTATWIILSILAIVGIARGIYVTKSELHRLENYRIS